MFFPMSFGIGELPRKLSTHSIDFAEFFLALHEQRFDIGNTQLEKCQVLLDTTATTLRELNDVLLRDSQHFLALLQEVQTLAAAAEQQEAEETVQRANYFCIASAVCLASKRWCVR
ncbi:MAG TPA: hypothetical protein PKA58_35845 [Polyangium sp.]|nr:hypothetical protein [Polyangium sp.]